MMPDPVQPGEDPSDDIEDLRNTVTLRLGQEPLMQVKIGNIEQSLDNVAMNADTIQEFVTNQLPKGGNNLKSVLVKTTMGPTVEVN